MDNYGVCTLSDAKNLANDLLKHGAIVFPFKTDEFTVHVIFICANFQRLGNVAPFGGNPVGNCYVGISRKGFFQVKLSNRTNTLTPEYIAEKFNLGNVDNDAEAIAELLNSMAEHI
jgi:hypothetical protein